MAILTPINNYMSCRGSYHAPFCNLYYIYMGKGKFWVKGSFGNKTILVNDKIIGNTRVKTLLCTSQRQMTQTV